jgi:hypothetical protein
MYRQAQFSASRTARAPQQRRYVTLSLGYRPPDLEIASHGFRLKEVVLLSSNGMMLADFHHGG